MKKWICKVVSKETELSITCKKCRHSVIHKEYSNCSNWCLEGRCHCDTVDIDFEMEDMFTEKDFEI